MLSALPRRRDAGQRRSGFPLGSLALRLRLPLLLVGTAIALTACGPSADVSGPPNAEEKPSVELRGGELSRYTPEGKLVWVLRSPSLAYYEDTKQTRAQDVEVRFFDAQGREALVLRAQELVFFHETGDFALRGSIVGEDPEGLRFQTEEARWVEREGVLRGNRPIDVERPDAKLSGRGFEYRPRTGELIVHDARLRLFLPLSSDDG